MFWIERKLIDFFFFFETVDLENRIKILEMQLSNAEEFGGDRGDKKSKLYDKYVGFF